MLSALLISIRYSKAGKAASLREGAFVRIIIT
jgi:hypothetical protein